jgi:ankyrin repeat protein
MHTLTHLSTTHMHGQTLKYCTGGHTEVVRLLLQNGANASLPAHASANYTATLLAQQQQQQQQQQLQLGAEIDATGVVEVSETEPGDVPQSDAPFKEGVTPLMMAARHGHLEVVKLLLEHGAIVTAQVRKIQKKRCFHCCTTALLPSLWCSSSSANLHIRLQRARLLLLHCSVTGGAIIAAAGSRTYDHTTIVALLLHV